MAAKLKAEGFEAQSTRLPESLRAAYENHNTLVRGEAARVHAEYFARFREQCSPKLRDLLLEGQQVSDCQLAECRSRRQEFQRQLEALLADFDVLLTPPGLAGANCLTKKDSVGRRERHEFGAVTGYSARAQSDPGPVGGFT